MAIGNLYGQISCITNNLKYSTKQWKHRTKSTWHDIVITNLYKQIPCITNTLYFYFIMILLSIYIYNWIGNKFLQLTSPSPYKYINSINKTNQMTANVQAISIIISKLSKIMSN